MCLEINATIDEKGDLVFMQADGLIPTETDELLALITKLAGEPKKVTKREEYHKPLVKIDAQERVGK